jgi:hypothetical protein
MALDRLAWSDPVMAELFVEMTETSRAIQADLATLRAGFRYIDQRLDAIEPLLVCDEEPPGLAY